MSLHFRSALPASIMLAGVLLAACEGDSRPFQESVEVATLGLTNLQITPPANAQETIYINTGQSLQVGISGFSEDSDEAVTLGAGDRNYSSSNPAVLSVNDNGVVTGGTVPDGESVAAEITVKIGDLTSESLTINVSNATLTSITSIEGSESLEACLPGEYFAEGLFTDDTTRTLFTADFDLVEGNEATLDEEPGLASVNATGSTDITLIAQVGDISTTRQLQVLQNLDSIAITPADPEVNEGETLELTATGTYLPTEEGGASRDEDITANVQWGISTGTDNASVGNSEDDKGELTGIAEGSATVQASCGTAGTIQASVTVGDAEDDESDELTFRTNGSQNTINVIVGGTPFQLDVSRGSEYDADDRELGDVRYTGFNQGGVRAIDLNAVQNGQVIGITEDATAQITATLFNSSGDEEATGSVSVRVSGP